MDDGGAVEGCKGMDALRCGEGHQAHAVLVACLADSVGHRSFFEVAAEEALDAGGAEFSGPENGQSCFFGPLGLVKRGSSNARGAPFALFTSRQTVEHATRNLPLAPAVLAEFRVSIVYGGIYRIHTVKNISQQGANLPAQEGCKTYPYLAPC